jgi:hypothetical protein
MLKMLGQNITIDQKYLNEKQNGQEIKDMILLKEG